MIHSDVAIIILNFYPPMIVKRAVDSVMRQDYTGSWTIYLGFHNRNREHKDAVREQFQTLPVEYVDIHKDLVSDTRAKNVILQYALNNGDHKYLFFLDDDDEWHPDYLRKMTSRCESFVTCGKEILVEETGQLRTVMDDIDYEGMGFSFDLWKGKELPWFVKQLCDKFILREFSAAYPKHSHIAEPLYTIHQHSSSLTYTLAMGRDTGEQKAGGTIQKIGVVVPDHIPDGLNQIARVPGIQTVNPCSQLDYSEYDALIAQPEFWEKQEEYPKRMVRAVYAEKYNQFSAACKVDADMVLPSEPMWIDELANDFPVIPVGIPSSISPEDVEGNAERTAKRSGRPRYYCIISKEIHPIETVRISDMAPPDWEQCTDLEDADVCIDLTAEKEDWCPGILRSFVSGIPCISYSFSSAHKILFGTSGLAIKQLEEIGPILRQFDAVRQKDQLIKNLRLYSRCYQPFFWFNFLVRYLEAGRKF